MASQGAPVALCVVCGKKAQSHCTTCAGINDKTRHLPRTFYCGKACQTDHWKREYTKLTLGDHTTEAKVTSYNVARPAFREDKARFDRKMFRQVASLGPGFRKMMEDDKNNGSYQPFKSIF